MYFFNIDTWNTLLIKANSGHKASWYATFPIFLSILTGSMNLGFRLSLLPNLSTPWMVPLSKILFFLAYLKLDWSSSFVDIALLLSLSRFDSINGSLLFYEPPKSIMHALSMSSKVCSSSFRLTIGFRVESRVKLLLSPYHFLYTPPKIRSKMFVSVWDDR